MLLHFFISCKPGSVTPPDSSYLDSAIQWTHDKVSVISDLTLDKSITWSKQFSSDILERSKELFRYLSGAPLPLSPVSPTLPDSTTVVQKEEISTWSFANLFSGLRGLKGGPTAELLREAEGQVWTDGEVHADLIRVRNASRYVLY
jgi:import inner membrane translocase subunit TIM21